MTTGNPYKRTVQNEGRPGPLTHAPKGIGTAILVTGLVILAYGATGFWLIYTLPPNGGASGRLPSLYVMGIGIVTAVVGLAARDLRIRRNEDDNASAKGIPTALGIAGLVAIIILLIIVVSRM